MTRPLDQTDTLTIPLPRRSFSDLPIGAYLNDRFEVVQTFDVKPQMNTYLVDDTRTQEQRLLYEASDTSQFEREREMLAHHLDHPALVCLVDAFQLTYGADARSYLALEFPLTPAPVENLTETEILQWGAQLADALGHLHDRGLAHGNIQTASLVLSHDQIKLWGYTQISALTPAAQARDVYMLAETLAELARPLPSLSPAPATVLQRACAVDPQARYADARAFHADWRAALGEAQHAGGLTTLVGRLSDVGRRREVDEDALLTAELTQFTQMGYQVLGLYAVADGMGGASAGEVASRLATESLARFVMERIWTPYWKQAPGEMDYGGLLKAAVEQANADVFAARQSMHSNMGTTLVAALLVNTQAYIANVGDSRAYLVSRDRIERITKDHSLVQALVDRGQIGEDHVRTHPHRNYILRNIGDRNHVDVDLFTVTVAPGQDLLLCCDGLWELVPNDDALRQIIVASPTPQEAARKLVETANANGGDDNITCVLVRLQSAKTGST